MMAFVVSLQLGVSHLCGFGRPAMSAHIKMGTITSMSTAGAQPARSKPTVSRRTWVKWLAFPLLFPVHTAFADSSTRYDVLTSRRYIDIGRPEPPNAPAPSFKEGIATFALDDKLQAQDVVIGSGDKAVRPSSLVAARWVVFLSDGTMVDDANERQAAFFRPGAHQVIPGIEDAVIGMRSGGRRTVVGYAERILT